LVSHSEIKKNSLLDLFIKKNEVGRKYRNTEFMGRGIVHRILVVKSHEKKSFGRPGLGWEANIKMNLRDSSCGDVNCVKLFQYRVKQRTSVNPMMCLEFRNA
jgi:hypothetical protein